MKCDTNSTEFGGICCCNCKYSRELFKHPMNNVFKGSIMESARLYACIAQFDPEPDYTAILRETPHGLCELHSPRK